MKGIVLTRGTGSRMSPMPLAASKHLLPVYDKPMIYYPLSVLMLAGIRDVLMIATVEDLPAYQRLFGDGGGLGMNIRFASQPYPGGLAQAFTIGADFIGNDSVCLVLGDNIFYGQGFSAKLQKAASRTSGATVFGVEVHDLHRFGVVDFDENMRALSIEEKPVQPKSKFAVTGLYFYDNQVIDIASSVIPDKTGELGISCINNVYLAHDSLNVEILSRGFNWLDAGTVESLMQATRFVESVQQQHGFRIACLEEIVLRKGCIGIEQVSQAARRIGDNSYGRYLQELCPNSGAYNRI